MIRGKSELVGWREIMPYTPWKNKKTLERKIQSDGFPSHMIEGRRMYDIQEVQLWFKRREHTKAS